MKIRLRLMIAIPVMTSLLVLGLGLAIIKLIELELIAVSIPLDVAQQNVRIVTTMGHVTIVVLFFGVLALVSGLILASTITGPIRRLAAGTEHVARGDLTRTIHLGGDDEMAMLGSAFNNMIGSINKHLLRSMSGGVLTINEKGDVTAISTDAEVILGLQAHDYTGKHISRMIPVSLENEVFHETIRATIEERHTFSDKEMSISTRNRDNVPISISTSFLKDQDDTLIGLIISFDDVAHLRKVRDQMRNVDRLTTLGGLAAGIAHQVRNPLCSIRGLAQILRENAASEENPQLADYSDVILNDVDRIDDVIERLLKFIQPTTSEWTFSPVSRVITDALLLAQHDVKKKDIDVAVDVPDDLPDVLCQEENLLQAFLNLIVNAVQAVEKNGRIEIRASLETGKSGSVKIQVSDNGCGISENNLRRVFTPSFTTKDDGAGFGLVITRQTIEAHGGGITVESVPGKQTVFSILLPVQEKNA